MACVRQSGETLQMTSSDLAQYVVSPDELQFAEYCFKVPVKMTVRPKEDPIVFDIRKMVTALLNSFGGIITIENIMQVGSMVVDHWKMGLVDQLRNFLPDDIYLRCVLVRNGDQLGTLNLIIKKANRVVTINYGMYIRGIAETISVKDSVVAYSVMTAHPVNKCQMSRSQLFPETLNYGDGLYLSEQDNIEFKYWKAMTSADLIRRISQDRTLNVLFAMPNIPQGGSLILGIEEAMDAIRPRAIGQRLGESEESILADSLEELLTNGPDNKQSIWGTNCSKPIRGEHWDISYIPLVNCPNNERRVVIHISLEHVSGGVFRHQPESYIVADSGNVQAMDMSTWKELVYVFNEQHCVSASPVVYRPKDPEPKEIQQRNSEVSLFHQNSTIVEEYSGKQQDHGQDMSMCEFIDALEQMNHPKLLGKFQAKGGIECANSDFNRLSWTHCCHDWKRFIISKKDTRYSGHHELLHLTNPIRFIPDEAIIRAACPLHTQLVEEVFHDMKTRHQTGIVLASKNLHKLSNCELAVPPHHVVDLLYLSDECSPELWVVFSKNASQSDGQKMWSYAMIQGRCIKRHLMETTLSKRKFKLQTVHIQCRVWNPNCSHQHGQTEQSLIEFLKPHQSQWQDLQVCACDMWMKQNAFFKVHVDNERVIQLTMEQMSCLFGMDVCRFNIIEGPPGSGKTLLAIYLCKNVFFADKHVVLTPNLSLKAYFEYQGIKSICVQTDSDVLHFLERDGLVGCQCIVIDDGHALYLQDSTWKYLLHEIFRHQNILFLLMDNRIQNFQGFDTSSAIRKKFCEFTNHSKESIMIRWLKSVHRNTHKVTSFVAANFSDLRIPCGHNCEGDDVEIRRVPNLFLHSDDNGLIRFVRHLVDPVVVLAGDNIAYDVRDIVILVHDISTVNSFRETFRCYEPTIRVQGADTFPVTGLIIDHVNNFCGLDSKVCIFVAPDSSSSANHELLKNPKYKAFIASRAIFRLVFVMEYLNPIKE